VDWSESMAAVTAEHARKEAGRYPAGLPSKIDGQMLFLQEMVSKARTADEGGGRVAVVLNGSPLFSGDAGSGESNIRKWLFENDLVEAIIGLPDQMFYNTGIYTYIWVLSTKKHPERQGLVQLIDARDLYRKMAKSLGDKRNELAPEHITEIVGLYESFVECPRNKIMRNEQFGYTKVTVERPLRLRYVLNEESRAKIEADKALCKLVADKRDAILEAVAADADWLTANYEEAAAKIEVWASKPGKPTKAIKDALLSAVGVVDPEGDPVPDGKGGFKPDVALRDAEYIPLTESVEEFVGEKVLPYAPDAWTVADSGKVGYEVPFTKVFYTFEPPRALEEIDAAIRASEKRILEMISEVSG
jgi:type I restriction enzyme M protein